MHHAVMIFPTDYAMHPAELAVEVESRGFESLWSAEHSHIPASRLSNGRFLFGVGAGWNIEEMNNHGTSGEGRFKLMRERIEAMKAIWTQDEASYDGENVSFDRIIANPKPTQKPHPPIHVGGAFPGGLRRAVRYGDGWIPLMGRGDDDIVKHMGAFRAAATGAGRNPTRWKSPCSRCLRTKKPFIATPTPAFRESSSACPRLAATSSCPSWTFSPDWRDPPRTKACRARLAPTPHRRLPSRFGRCASKVPQTREQPRK